MKKPLRKPVEQTEIPKDATCGTCAMGAIYRAFHTLSIKGEPTMKTCPHSIYKRLLSERACANYTRER